MEIIGSLLPHITEAGGYFRMRLTDLARHFGFIKEVRGTGLMIGVEMDFACKDLVRIALEHGLLINVTHDTVLRMLPPYIITEEQVDRAIIGLKKVFARSKA
jgi:acetylornithine/succinyldiaminopimelate/putrescine aminotransferase